MSDLKGSKAEKWIIIGGIAIAFVAIIVLVAVIGG